MTTQTINHAKKKLEDGYNVLAQANNNPIILAGALQTIHGALEDGCRLWLSQPNISRQHGIKVQNRSDANWQTLLDLMPKHYQWSNSNVRYVRKMNGMRNNAAHGDGFEGTRADVEQYATFVQNIFDNNGYCTANTPNSRPRYNQPQNNNSWNNFPQYSYPRNNHQNQRNHAYLRTIFSGALNCPGCGSSKIKRIGKWESILLICRVFAYGNAASGGYMLGLSLSTGNNSVFVIIASIISIIFNTFFWLIPVFAIYKINPITSFECSQCSHRWKEASSPLIRRLINSLIKTAGVCLLIGWFLSLF